MKRLSLTTQFTFLIVLLAGITAYAIYEIGSAINRVETLSQARTVANLVEDLGTLASRYKGVWIKSDPSYEIGNALEVNQFTTEEIKDLHSSMSSPDANISFHRKNPALIQRELSDVTQTSKSPAKFRITSDKPMNPNNAPNAFEIKAINKIRKSNQDEYSEASDATYNYARKIIATKSCLSCHSTPEAAPAAVRANYGDEQGYGYKEGEVVGVISVTIPNTYTLSSFISTFDLRAWCAVVLMLASILSMIVFVRQAMIKPIKQLKQYADIASKADPSENVNQPELVPNEHQSSNEIHQLSASLRALREAINFFYRRSRTDKENVTRLHR